MANKVKKKPQAAPTAAAPAGVVAAAAAAAATAASTAVKVQQTSSPAAKAVPSAPSVPPAAPPATSAKAEEEEALPGISEDEEDEELYEHDMQLAHQSPSSSSLPSAPPSSNASTGPSKAIIIETPTTKTATQTTTTASSISTGALPENNGTAGNANVAHVAHVAQVADDADDDSDDEVAEQKTLPSGPSSAAGGGGSAGASSGAKKKRKKKKAPGSAAKQDAGAPVPPTAALAATAASVTTAISADEKKKRAAAPLSSATAPTPPAQKPPPAAAPTSAPGAASAATAKKAPTPAASQPAKRTDTGKPQPHQAAAAAPTPTENKPSSPSSPSSAGTQMSEIVARLPEANAQSKMRLAIALEAAKSPAASFEMTLRLLEAAVENSTDPKEAQFRSLVFQECASQCFKHKKFKLCIEFCDQALDEPTPAPDFKALYTRGLALEAEGNVLASLADFQRLKLNYPKNPLAIANCNRLEQLVNSSTNPFLSSDDSSDARATLNGVKLPSFKLPNGSATGAPGMFSSLYPSSLAKGASADGSAVNSLYSAASNLASSSMSSLKSLFSPPPAKRVVPGLAGLQNLGNTCFMNSILQCLSSARDFRDFFLSDKFVADINQSNVLGMQGLMAHAYAALMKQIWSGEVDVVAPNQLKLVTSKFNTQFSGFGQHDSQEFMSFLLDGLHEDLNRILKKPYFENVEAQPGESEATVADRAWDQHRQRNDSHVVDLFQGQYRSRLTCPECAKVSITFDPFMYLSLPIPTTHTKSLDVVTVLQRPWQSRLIVRSVLTVPKVGPLSALQKAVGALLDRDPEKFILCKLYMSRFQVIFRDDDRIERLMDEDQIFAFELLNEDELPESLRGDPLAAGGSGSDSDSDSDSDDNDNDVKETESSVGAAADERKGSDSASQASVSADSSVALETSKSYTDVDAMPTVAAGTVIALPPPPPPPPLLATPGQGIPPPPPLLPSGPSRSLKQAKQAKPAMVHIPIIFRVTQLLTKSPEDSCAACAAPRTADFMRCSKCKCTRYCNEQCQSAHWPEHKKICLAPRKQPLGIPIVLSTTKQTLKYDALQTAIYDKLRDYLDLDGTDASDLFRVACVDKMAMDDTTLGVELAPESDADIPMDRVKGFSVDWLLSGDGEFFRSCAEKRVYEHESYKKAVDSNALVQKVTLQQCLRLFTEEEKLSEQEAWYCANCKKHQQATKCLHLWRLPKILVVHLKRFSFTRIFKDKLETFIDFPFEGLDLSEFVKSTLPAGQSPIYDLFAVSNHFGMAFGGHYTAYANYSPRSAFPSTGEPPLSDQDAVGRWFNFDDTRVSEIAKDRVKSSNAYVLFYRMRDADA